MRHAPEADGSEPPREPAPLVRFAGLILDLDACMLARESGEAIPLTRGEFALLRAFVTRPGRVVSRDTLLDALASRRFEPFDRSVDVLIGRLRRKIEPDPKEPRLIVTVPGEGYRFDGRPKTMMADEMRSIAGLAPQNDEPPLEQDVRNPAPSEEDAEVELTAAEAKPARLARQAGQARPLATEPRFGLVPLATAIIFLILLATVGCWLLLGGRLMNPPHAPHLSIVVLPFANLSGDPAQDYFVDGVTENLTTQISRMSDSLVIARNTAFTYKGRNVDAKEIGRRLGVRYALEGSVQRDLGRLRVNAQLIDTETGAHLWADQFDEDVADLLKVQDQVVARLARALGPELVRAEAERGRIPKIRTPSIWPFGAGTSSCAPIDSPRKTSARPSTRPGICSTARSRLIPTTPWRRLEAPKPTWLIMASGGVIPEPTTKPKCWGRPIGRLCSIHQISLRTTQSQCIYRKRGGPAKPLMSQTSDSPSIPMTSCSICRAPAPKMLSAASSRRGPTQSGRCG